MNEFPLSKKFLDGFKKHSKYEISNVYRHVFTCMEYESLERLLNRLNGLVTQEGWFYLFHKSMRQIDFFSTVYVPYFVDETTDQDRLKMDTLKTILPFNRRIPTYVDVDRAIDMDLEVEMNEYFKLKRKSKTEHRRNISGHMDMILWNLIHVDSENFLENYIENFFKSE